MSNHENGVLQALQSQIEAIRLHRDRQGRPSLKKPLLLLLVLSKLDRGQLGDNKIRFAAVADELADLIRRYGGRDSRGSAGPDQPFVYLKTAPFWELHLPADAPEKSADQRKRAVLSSPDTYASLSAAAFDLLKDSSVARRSVASTILGKWWDGAEREQLRAALKL